jgi:hypothetical protein
MNKTSTCSVTKLQDFWRGPHLRINSDLFCQLMVDLIELEVPIETCLRVGTCALEIDRI